VDQSRSRQNREVKILDPIGTRILILSVVQPVASHYTDCATAAHERQYDVNKINYSTERNNAYSTNLKNLKKISNVIL
jgi:hypothetical protein